MAKQSSGQNFLRNSFLEKGKLLSCGQKVDLDNGVVVFVPRFYSALLAVRENFGSKLINNSINMSELKNKPKKKAQSK